MQRREVKAIILILTFCLSALQVSSRLKSKEDKDPNIMTGYLILNGAVNKITINKSQKDENKLVFKVIQKYYQTLQRDWIFGALDYANNIEYLAKDKILSVNEIEEGKEIRHKETFTYLNEIKNKCVRSYLEEKRKWWFRTERDKNFINLQAIKETRLHDKTLKKEIVKVYDLCFVMGDENYDFNFFKKFIKH